MTVQNLEDIVAALPLSPSSSYANWRPGALKNKTNGSAAETAPLTDAAAHTISFGYTDSDESVRKKVSREPFVPTYLPQRCQALQCENRGGR